MLFILCGFGSFFFVQAAKTLVLSSTSWTTSSMRKFKLVLALIGSFGMATFFTYRSPIHLISYGTAGAGLAVLVHKSVRVLSAIGDKSVIEILRSRSR